MQLISPAQAKIDISASPTSIDTGDRMRVTINLEQVHPDGVILKILYPQALHYVLNSARLQAAGATKAVSLTPAFDEPADHTVDSGVFLVFFLAAKSFGKQYQGILTFELEAVRKLQDGEIGVDADVDDQASRTRGNLM